jgi:hypothetical protein
MEYLKQFEMNKIELFNKHVKLPKKVYTCNGTFKKPYFTWNYFKPFSCLIHISQQISYFQCQ